MADDCVTWSRLGRRLFFDNDAPERTCEQLMVAARHKRVQFRQTASSYSRLRHHPPVSQLSHASNCACSHAGSKHVYFLMLQPLVDVRGTAGFGAPVLASFFCPVCRRPEVLTKSQMQSRSVSMADQWQKYVLIVLSPLWHLDLVSYFCIIHLFV